MHQQPGHDQNPYAPPPGAHQQAEPNFAPGAYVDPRAQLASGVDRFMSNVFMWMAAGLGVSAAAAALPALDGYRTIAMLFESVPFMQWILLLAPLPMVFFLSARMWKMSPTGALLGFFAFAALEGLSLFWIPIVYDMGSIIGVFGVTSVMFASLALFGYVTKRDLGPMGNFLFMALIGLIVASLVNVFVGGMSMIIAGVGVLIFAGLTAWDTQNLKQLYLERGGEGNLAVYGALTLYLDFINIFLFLLRLFGGGRD